MHTTSSLSTTWGPYIHNFLSLAYQIVPVHCVATNATDVCPSWYQVSLFLLWGFDGGEDQKLSGIFVWSNEELHKCHPLSGTAWAQEYQCCTNSHRSTVVKKRRGGGGCSAAADFVVIPD